MIAELRGQKGFTLLEVLVAVTIVGLGMIAIFAQLNQSLLSVELVRERTLAHWVATDRLTELRLRGEWPAVGERSGDVDLGPYRWRYTLRISETPGARLRRLDISVAHSDTPERPVSTLVGFIGEPAGTAVPPAAWSPAGLAPAGGIPNGTPGEQDEPGSRR